MSIFDSLKRNAMNSAANAVKNAANKLGNTSETFKFSALPESLDEMKALPEAAMSTPFQTAALTVCALCVYAAAPEIGTEMLNWLKGPQPLSPMEQQFLRDRFRDGKTYIPFSYFKGAKPENDYTPDEPFTVTISANPYSFQESGYAVLWLTSGGADNPRDVKLRQKPSTGEWFLWDQHLIVGIRDPKSADPWA